MTLIVQQLKQVKNMECLVVEKDVELIEKLEKLEDSKI
jgi:hypothetical protein